MGSVEDSKIKLKDILTELQMLDIFPKYLLDLLAYTGFTNYQSLSAFEENDLKKIEVFARTILPTLIDPNEKEEFYGIFLRDTSLFYIVEGHQKLLQILSKKCQNQLSILLTESSTELKRKINLRGKPHIPESAKKKFKRNRLQNDTPSATSTKSGSPEVSDSNEDGIDKNASKNDDTIDGVKEHIINVVKHYQMKYLETVSEEEKENTLPLLEHINVEVDDNCASVQCVKCDFKSRAYLQTSSNEKKKWIFSNVHRHFRTHFSNKNKKKESTSKSKCLSILTYFKKDDKHLEKNSFQGALNCENLDQSSNSSIQYLDLDLDDYQASDNTGDNIPHNRLNQLPDNEGPSTSTVGLLANNLDPDLDQDFSFSRVDSEGLGEGPIKMDNRVGNSASTPSRQLRTKTARMLTFNESQSKITDYFERVCKNIECEIQKNSQLKTNFISGMNIITRNNKDKSHTFDEPLTFFHMLKRAAENNSRNIKDDVTEQRGNRYPEKLKKLCSYLFLTAGRLAYETLAANLSYGIPSRATIGRSIARFEKYIEGETSFAALKVFLEKRNYPLTIFISEDQTAITSRFRYNSSTNQILGPVLETSNQTGFPLMGQNNVNCINDIKKVLQKKLAKNAYIFMAQPLVDGSPAFCLSIFGSDNCFCFEDVLLRWNYIRQEANNHGITVQGFSSDGDTRCLKAMKIMSGLAITTAITQSSTDDESCSVKENIRTSKSTDKLPTEDTTEYSPYFQLKFSCKKPVIIQDPIHVSTKLKTRLLNSKVDLIMGTYSVAKDHLQDLINKYPRDRHFLCSSYLDSRDKMNFEAIDKLSSPCVTYALMEDDKYKATRQFLIITRFVFDSFIDKSLTIEKRIYLIWYSTFFLRLWRGWMKYVIDKEKPRGKQKKKQEKENIHCLKLSKNWLTVYTYTCIELNAHGLIFMIEKCRSQPNLLLPWLCTSQPCERYFRQTRSMTSTYSTVVNFDILEFIQRRNRIQTLNSIVSDAGNDFIFPREKSGKLGRNKSTQHGELPTCDQIKNILENAKQSAITDSNSLGMFLPDDIQEQVLRTVSIPHIEDTEAGTEEDTEEDADEGTEPTEEQTISFEEISEIPEEQDEYFNDIREELALFSDFENLNITDFSDKCKPNDTTLLKILVNGKEKIVKKSTLCWLFSKDLHKGRLSSDRLLRCKSLSSAKIPKTEKRTKTRIKRNQVDQENNKSDTTSGEEDIVELESEFEYESIHSGTDSDIDNAVNKIINKESYYAVCYDSWYIGRVVNKISETQSKIKFLKFELNKYIWPKDDDVQVVQNEYIFYGPIQLIGNCPFQLKRHDKLMIEKAFKHVKKELKHLF